MLNRLIMRFGRGAGSAVLATVGVKMISLEGLWSEVVIAVVTGVIMVLDKYVRDLKGKK